MPRAVERNRCSCWRVGQRLFDGVRVVCAPPGAFAGCIDLQSGKAGAVGLRFGAEVELGLAARRNDADGGAALADSERRDACLQRSERLLLSRCAVAEDEVAAGALRCCSARYLEQTAVAPRCRMVAERERLRERSSDLRGAREPQLLESSEQAVAPLERRGGMVGGREAGGRGDDGGQRCGLCEGELAGRFAEVDLGRRRHACRTRTEVDPVEVGLEDGWLAERVFGASGDNELAELSGDGPL